MKSTEHFKRTIQAYLQQRASEDRLFAESYRKEGKNIDDCITYILNEVQRSGCNGFTDGEIYSMAVHYYDEDDIEVGNPVSCQVSVNHIVELTEEEKAEARQRAVEQYQQAELRRMQERHKSQPIQFLIMKPRTSIQKEVARLSRRLPAISETQKAYAYRHCFKHFGRRTTKGIIHCTECGHSWKGGHTLADTICGCKCPHKDMDGARSRTCPVLPELVDIGTAFAGSSKHSLLYGCCRHRICVPADGGDLDEPTVENESDGRCFQQRERELHAGDTYD